MADHAEDDNDGDIYVYRGGRAPQHVTHVRIHKSVDEIEEWAFLNCMRLVKVETHNGIRKVGKCAFNKCTLLPQINLKSVSEIDDGAFCWCENLAHVEFGDELGRIGGSAFAYCISLEHLNLPSIITIETHAFMDCAFTDIQLPERLETIASLAFFRCERLRRIAIPLKRHLFPFDDRRQRFSQFENCSHISTVVFVGGFLKTVASLHMDSWRTSIISKINDMNRVLSICAAEDKTNMIEHFMEGLKDKIDRYKCEHNRYVKEGIVLLELALWKAKLAENEKSPAEGRTKKTKVDAECAR